MKSASPDAGTRSLNRPLWLAAIGILVVMLGVWFRHAGAHDAAPTPLDSQALDRRATEQPGDLQAQIDWGADLVRSRRLDEAATVLAHAHQIAPHDARPYAWLGMAAVAERRVEEARSLFDEALQHDPDNLTALRGLADLDARSRHIRHAIAGFEHLIRLRPNDADTWQRLGILYASQGQHARALDTLSRAAALAPDDLFTQRALGMIALPAGNLDLANRALREVVARQPDDAGTLAALAIVTMRMDTLPTALAAAEQLADRALRLQPTGDAYNTRGRILMAQRRFAEAIRDFQTAIRVEPAERSNYLLLSQCYASAGQPDKARGASSEYQRLAAAQASRGKMVERPKEPMR